MTVEQVLGLAVCIGVIPGLIAKNKGYSFVGWWFRGALLFVLALPMAILLKPKEAGLAQRGARKCPFCAEFIKSEANVCRFCGRESNPSTEAGASPQAQHGSAFSTWIRGDARWQPGGGAPPQGQYGSAASTAYAGTTNGFAIASLVLGLLGGSLLAVIFGHVANSQLRQRPGQGGKGMATAGLVLGYLSIVAIVILVIAAASSTNSGYDY